MRKVTVIGLLFALMLGLTGCVSCSPIKNQSSNAQTESKAPEESVPEQKMSAADFLKSILQKDAKISEVSARQQLWQAGYTPAEIKEAVEEVYPKASAATEVKKEESSKTEDSKAEESSKAAEESKNESSVKEETAKQEQSSKPNQEASEGSNADGSNAQATEQSKAEETASAPETANQPEQEQTAAAEQTTSEPQQTQSAPDQTESTKTEQSQAPAHVHTWVDVTEVVHHDEVGHYETVVIQEAWDETVEKTEIRDVQKYKCTCGKVFDTASEWGVHSDSYNEESPEFGMHDGWTAIYVSETIVVGTETVHHDAVTEQQWVVDQAAYDEEKVVGQKCSECGATQ